MNGKTEDDIFEKSTTEKADDAKTSTSLLKSSTDKLEKTESSVD